MPYTIRNYLVSQDVSVVFDHLRGAGGKDLDDGDVGSLEEAQRLFDEDGDGRITKADLPKVNERLRAQGRATISPEAWDKVLDELDRHFAMRALKPGTRMLGASVALEQRNAGRELASAALSPVAQVFVEHGYRNDWAAGLALRGGLWQRETRFATGSQKHFAAEIYGKKRYSLTTGLNFLWQVCHGFEVAVVRHESKQGRDSASNTSAKIQLNGAAGLEYATRAGNRFTLALDVRGFLEWQTGPNVSIYAYQNFTTQPTAPGEPVVPNIPVHGGLRLSASF